MCAIDFHTLSQHMSKAFERVGASVMRLYKTDFHVSYKEDESPVTDVDILAEKAIKLAIQKITPDIPTFGEESFQASVAPSTRRYWLIDPIDGTKAFIAGNNIFTLNAGLIENSRPLFGIVYSPLTDQMYIGSPLGAFSNETPIRTRTIPKTGAVVANNAGCATHIQARKFLKKYKIDKFLNLTSSIKICRIAEGRADIYPKFGPTCEWDTAAAHAVLQYAGGSIKTEDEKELMYGKPDFKNSSFICVG